MADALPQKHDPTEPTAGWLRCLPVLVLAVIALGAVTVVAHAAPVVLLTDGVYVVALLLSAAGWGGWLVVWLGLGHRSALQQCCLALALGLGLLGIVTQVLGLVGGLSQVLAWILLAIGGVLGLARLYSAQTTTPSAKDSVAAGGSPAEGARRRDSKKTASEPQAATKKQAGRTRTNDLNVDKSGTKVSITLSRAAIVLRCAGLLPLAIPLAVMVLGALLPPGVIWLGEARGYDVLEYHLQAPREYFEQGAIHFLPHNVYAAFPQQVESLNLLLMYLIGDAHAAAIPAQLLHAALGVLTIIALAAWTTPGWRRFLVTLVAGVVPWMAYLGCLAYVELGMLFFTAVAAGLVLDHFRPGTRVDWRWALAAGLCAGLACGCKYTAIALVAIALGCSWLLLSRGSWVVRIRQVGLFTIGALLTFSPWLIRNTVLGGNPVYPFAYEWFGGKAWSTEQAEQWARGHRVPEEHNSVAGRAYLTWSELIKSPMYGGVIWVLALAGVVIWPGRRAWLLVLWLGLILAVWICCTHMPGRFALVALVPAVLLAGGASDNSGGRHLHKIRSALLCLAIAGAIYGSVTLIRLWRGGDAWWRGNTGVSLVEMLGLPEYFVKANLINRTATNQHDYVWMVGDARAFYIQPHMHYTVPFSRDPWIEQAESGASPQECIAWLRTQDVTHVVFSWSEIRRLRTSYGFSPAVTHEWVAELSACGLRRVAEIPGRDGPDVEIFEIVRE
ncbi:MAG: hypothetical protein ABIG44_10235 [Planctomycetota bacterium]